MQDAIDSRTRDDSAAPAQRRTRQDRQARVGILRNPNSPPRPPTRRASLTGRWPSLRSSRRPSSAAVAEAAESVVTTLTADQDGPRPVVPVRHAADGSVQAIDVAGLMASVEAVGTAAPVRAAYAAHIRPDGEAAPATVSGTRPSVLTAAAWMDEDEDALAQAFRHPAPDAEMPSAPPARRSRGWWIVGLGVALALAVLVLLPAWRLLLPA